MIQITSYEYRSEPLFLCNQFSGVGMFSVPLIRKQAVRLEDFVLIGYDKINQSNETGKTVHFFPDDQAAGNRTQYGFKRLLSVRSALKISVYGSIPAISCLARSKISSLKTAQH